jgi:hypothetical protein
MHRFNDEMYRERGGLGGLDRAREEALEPGPLPITLAAEAIEAKIAELGGRLGARVSDIVNIHDLIYAQALEGASIYWGMRTGAHEIHGAIEEKRTSYRLAAGPAGTTISSTAPSIGIQTLARTKYTARSETNG